MSNRPQLSGTLGGSSFTNALITITGFGDTSNGSGLSLIPESVTVSGVGTATFTGPVSSAVSQTGRIGGAYFRSVLARLWPRSTLRLVRTRVGNGDFHRKQFRAHKDTMGSLNITASGNSTFTAAARIRDLDLIDLMAPEHSPSGGEYWSAGNSPPIFKRAFENLGGRANGPRGG